MSYEKPLPLDHQLELTISDKLRGTGGPTTGFRIAPAT
jgi:hypothetical protein